MSCRPSPAPCISLLLSHLFPLRKWAKQRRHYLRWGPCVGAVRDPVLCHLLATPLRVSSAHGTSTLAQRECPRTLALAWPSCFLPNCGPYLPNERALPCGSLPRCQFLLRKILEAVMTSLLMTPAHTYWICMCSKESSFMNTEIWVSGYFHVPWNMLHLIFFHNLKHKNCPYLSPFATKIGCGQDLSCSLSFNTEPRIKWSIVLLFPSNKWHNLFYSTSDLVKEFSINFYFLFFDNIVQIAENLT